jgi:hypothetical protein
MEDLTDKQGGFYREIGIFLRPATGSGLGRVPCGERLFGNQIVISPRWRNALLYSGQLVTL